MIPPAQYAEGYHPFRDYLFAPAWIFVELCVFGGAALTHNGFGAGLRTFAWVAGAALEVALKITILTIQTVGLAIRTLLVCSRFALGIVFYPAAVVYRLLSRFAGRTPDGITRLPALPGEESAESADVVPARVAGGRTLASG